MTDQINQPTPPGAVDPTGSCLTDRASQPPPSSSADRSTSASLRTHQLTWSVKGRDIISEVSIEAPSGAITGIVGPNGAGKSTLLRAIAGLLPGQSGRVEFADQPVGPPGSRQRALTMALVAPAWTDAPLTVADVVDLGRFPHRSPLASPSPRDADIAEAAMARVGVADLAGRRLATLSDGERQRVLLARALAQEPRVLLADEPTSHLDIGASGHVATLLRQAADDGLAIVAVIHDLTLAAGLCDQIVILAAGRVAAAGPSRQTLTRERIEAVYGVRCAVLAHPRTGAPVFVLG